MGLVDEVNTQATEAAEGRQPSAWLLGAQGAVAGVFATLQITGDVFSRMLANHPVWVGLALFFALIATALSVVTAILGKWFRVRFLMAGVFSFLAATICATVAALLVSTDRGKPIIAVTSLEASRLGVSVKLTNLKVRETVRVLIEPLVTTHAEGRGVRYDRAPRHEAIYEAAFGPDAKGDVDQAVSVDLPPIEFSHVGVRAWVGRPDDCYSETSKTTSCITLDVTPHPERPQLSATWDLTASNPRLTLKVSVNDLRPRDYAYLRILGTEGTELAAWTLAPSAAGSIEQTLQVPVPASVRAVCVEASTKELTDGKCSGGEEQTAWVRFAVPSHQP